MNNPTLTANQRSVWDKIRPQDVVFEFTTPVYIPFFDTKKRRMFAFCVASRHVFLSRVGASEPMVSFALADSEMKTYRNPELLFKVAVCVYHPTGQTIANVTFVIDMLESTFSRFKQSLGLLVKETKYANSLPFDASPRLMQLASFRRDARPSIRRPSLKASAGYTVTGPSGRTEDFAELYANVCLADIASPRARKDELLARLERARIGLQHAVQLLLTAAEAPDQEANSSAQRIGLALESIDKALKTINVEYQAIKDRFRELPGLPGVRSLTSGPRERILAQCRRICMDLRKQHTIAQGAEEPEDKLEALNLASCRLDTNLMLIMLHLVGEDEIPFLLEALPADTGACNVGERLLSLLPPNISMLNEQEIQLLKSKQSREDAELTVYDVITQKRDGKYGHLYLPANAPAYAQETASVLFDASKAIVNEAFVGCLQASSTRECSLESSWHWDEMEKARYVLCKSLSLFLRSTQQLFVHQAFSPANYDAMLSQAYHVVISIGCFVSRCAEMPAIKKRMPLFKSVPDYTLPYQTLSMYRDTDFAALSRTRSMSSYNMLRSSSSSSRSTSPAVSSRRAMLSHSGDSSRDSSPLKHEYHRPSRPPVGNAGMLPSTPPSPGIAMHTASVPDSPRTSDHFRGLNAELIRESRDAHSHLCGARDELLRETLARVDQVQRFLDAANQMFYALVCFETGGLDEDQRREWIETTVEFKESLQDMSATLEQEIAKRSSTIDEVVLLENSAGTVIREAVEHLQRAADGMIGLMNRLNVTLRATGAAESSSVDDQEDEQFGVLSEPSSAEEFQDSDDIIYMELPRDSSQQQRNSRLTAASLNPWSSKCIRSASLSRLVERMSYHKYADHLLTSTVIIFHKSFTTSSQLLESLLTRFQRAAIIKAESEDLQSWAPRIIRDRIMNVLRQWSKLCPEDFVDDVSLVERIVDFFAEIRDKVPNQQHFINQICSNVSALNASNRMNRRDSVSQPSPSPGLTDVDIFSFKVKEVARQLTIRTFRYFERIPPRSFLEGKDVGCPEASTKRQELSLQITHTCLWFAQQILRPSLKDRVKALQFVIKLADELTLLRNYELACGIISSTCLKTCIYRLHKTWAKVKSSPVYKSFSQLEKLYSPDKNYGALREKQTTAPSPCIPAVHIYRKQFIGLGVATKSDEGSLIAIEPRLKTMALLDELLRFQRAYYNFQRNDLLQEYFDRTLVISGDEEAFEQKLHELSNELEPGK